MRAPYINEKLALLLSTGMGPLPCSALYPLDFPIGSHCSSSKPHWIGLAPIGSPALPIWKFIEMAIFVKKILHHFMFPLVHPTHITIGLIALQPKIKISWHIFFIKKTSLCLLPRPNLVGCQSINDLAETSNLPSLKVSIYPLP